MRVFTSSVIALSAALMLTATGPGYADDGEWVHSASLIGEPGYPDGFPHFNYVNPDAPKGGVARLSGVSPTFDTLNPILPRGVAANGLGLIYETLFTSAFDEADISGEYPLIAEAKKVPSDLSSVTYRLNPNAKWHDGQPITAEDVVWSFEKTVELDPRRAFYYQHVTGAEITGDREITFTFDQTGNRELPLIVGQLLILPKHWWEGTDAQGNQRDIASGTLEPPLGSGPYRISSVNPGRSITYERVPDYWAADLNVNVGQNNFDEIRFEHYRDRNVEFEAFKADNFDYWAENEAKRWATGYNVPAVRDGRIIKELVELEQVSGVMVGFIPNVRREPFDDPLVRRALNYAFDFEDLNRRIFFDQYDRIGSFFHGIPLAATGLPEGEELEILETVRDQVPPEVFTEPYVNPVGGDGQKLRANLSKAVELLGEAGYTLDGNVMRNASGEPLTFEILLNTNVIEKVALAYQQWLARIGIEARVRSVDSNQFVSRVRSRDFDMIYSGWAQSNSPGNEQLNYWGSEAADRDSSQNYAGIKDPAVDELIRRVIFAEDREELVAATRALDRVLMANQYVIPSYTIIPERIAYWNRFGHPEGYGRFALGFPTIWWWDEEKAAQTGGRS
ncbi:extracellular solute-binding protein [Bauldia sp.]|uniref:extracellular solute-binding protein n=1 Tax=Bauldia sp. TaxID=2575872 RepID=UPI003BA92738